MTPFIPKPRGISIQTIKLLKIVGGKKVERRKKRSNFGRKKKQEEESFADIKKLLY